MEQILAGSAEIVHRPPPQPCARTRLTKLKSFVGYLGLLGDILLKENLREKKKKKGKRDTRVRWCLRRLSAKIPSRTLAPHPKKRKDHITSNKTIGILDSRF